MYSIGNEELLERDPAAVYCSREAHSSIYDQALKFARRMMSEPITLSGGWQSNIEKEALRSRRPGSSSNIIYVLAKGIQSFRLPKRLRTDLDRGKVLVLSLWMRDSRIDEKKVKKRDDFILDQMERFLFLNIREGGNLEELFFRCLELGKEVFLLDHPANETWVNPEVVPISGKDLTPLLP